MSAVLTLMMAAAPTPCSARAAASEGSDHARPQASELNVNRVSPEM